MLHSYKKLGLVTFDLGLSVYGLACYANPTFNELHINKLANSTNQFTQYVNTGRALCEHSIVVLLI